MTTLQEAAMRKALEALEAPTPGALTGSAESWSIWYDKRFIAMEELRTALAQQRGQQPVCHGCGIPAGDVHMSTCKSGKWPSRVSNGDTAAQALPAEELTDRLVAISSAVADSDDRKAQAMLSETLQLLAAARSQSEDGCVPNHMCNGHRVHIPTGECCNKCGATSW